MKKALAVLILLGAAALLMATKNPNHKISWCHFPPGQYPDKVLILSIDLAADGSIGPAHQNHKGDGPVCIGLKNEKPGVDCVPLPTDTPPGPGIKGFTDGLGTTCLGRGCPTVEDGAVQLEVCGG